MIPADHISFNDDGTAWLVMDHDYRDGPGTDADRPCDTCDGEGKYRNTQDGGYFEPCGICHGTGRHTFEIQVQTGESWPPVIVFPRVSIVPGMVLPIVEVDPPSVPYPDHDALVRYAGDDSEPWFVYTRHDDMTETVWTLPPAAAPGMWAVKLKITPDAR